MTDRRLVDLSAPTSLKCQSLLCRFEFTVDEARSVNRLGGGDELLCPRCHNDRLFFVWRK